MPVHLSVLEVKNKPHFELQSLCIYSCVFVDTNMTCQGLLQGCDLSRRLQDVFCRDCCREISFQDCYRNGFSGVLKRYVFQECCRDMTCQDCCRDMIVRTVAGIWLSGLLQGYDCQDCCRDMPCQDCCRICFLRTVTGICLVRTVICR
jgi:hypothetical protein